VIGTSTLSRLTELTELPDFTFYWAPINDVTLSGYIRPGNFGNRGGMILGTRTRRDFFWSFITLILLVLVPCACAVLVEMSR